LDCIQKHLPTQKSVFKHSQKIGKIGKKHRNFTNLKYTYRASTGNRRKLRDWVVVKPRTLKLKLSRQQLAKKKLV